MTDYTDLGFDKNFTKVESKDEASNGGEALSVPDGSVTTEKIRDQAVTDSKIKDVSFSKIIGGIATLGGQNNTNGELNVFSESGTNPLNIDGAGMYPGDDVKYGALYIKAGNTSISTAATTYGDRVVVEGTGVRTYYLCTHFVTLEASTWDASNFGKINVQLDEGGNASALSGDVTSAANFAGRFQTVSRTWANVSSTGHFAVKPKYSITESTGSPVVYAVQWGVYIVSLFTPITSTSLGSLF